MSSTVEMTRLANARRLCVHEAGNSMAEWGRRVGATNRQQANNWIGKNPAKAISSETARRIEAGFGRPVGWLDQEHGEGAPLGPEISIGAMPRPRQAPSASPLTEASIDSMTVSREWLRRHVGARAAEHMAVATVTGDAMRETLPEGSVVLVDRAVSAVRDDGIYMLGRSAAQESPPLFRRVSRKLDGTYLVTAENTAIPPESIRDWRSAKLLVLGRVVVAMEVRRL